MATKREYLVGKGLAKPGRGRFSKEANDALAAAEAAGVVFDEPVKPVKEVATEGDKPSQPSKPASESTKIREWASRNGITVGERGRLPQNVVTAFNADNPALAKGETVKVYKVEPQKRVRQVGGYMGLDAEGHRIGWSICTRCKYHVNLCACKSGPQPPKFIVKALDEPITY